MDIAKWLLAIRNESLVQIAQIVFLFLSIHHSVWAQVGTPLGGPPTLLSAETLWGSDKNNDGIENQLQLTTGAPLLKSDAFSLISQLSYQHLNLQKAPFSVISSTRFEALNLSLNGIYQQDSGNGWFVSGSFGSASDEMFSNSDVLTYNLIVQRKNKWSDMTAFLYGIYYSNNNALLPGLPIPMLSYEVQNKDTEDFLRIGFPLVLRKNHILPQTQLNLFTVGPVVWDVSLKNTTLSGVHFTIGANKRPDTFLLASSPVIPLNQLMVEQISVYTVVEWNSFENCKMGFKAAYNFTNHYRLRETGTTRDLFDQDRRFADYATFSFNVRFLAPIKSQGSK